MTFPLKARLKSQGNSPKMVMRSINQHWLVRIVLRSISYFRRDLWLIVTKAPILILDEPTNALDLKHEQWVIETLQRLRRLRTIILVTHRLETAVDCDRIFVMQEGEIVEDGTHAELLARQGLYFQMLGYPTVKPSRRSS